MTDKELERLERIAAQIVAGITANANDQACSLTAEKAVGIALVRAKELIKQLDALKIAE